MSKLIEAAEAAVGALENFVDSKVDAGEDGAGVQAITDFLKAEIKNEKRGINFNEGGAMNKFHQWKTQCPRCGDSDSMRVIGVTLTETHKRKVLGVPLQADGFVFDESKDFDHSTEDEKVKCITCDAEFELSDLAIDTYYKADPKALFGKTDKYTVELNASERSMFQLAIQSQALLRAINNASPADAERLEGIMGLVDSVRDQLAENAFEEGVVFPITQNEKEAVLKETEVEDLDI